MFNVKKILSILIVEDDIKDLDKILVLISCQFGNSVQVLTAKTLKKAEIIINKGIYDIAIIDLDLPDGHGENLISLIREQSFYTPIIVQTSEEDLAYQSMVHNKYENLTYLAKNKLLISLLEDRLEKIKIRHETNSHKRLYLRSRGKVISINTNEVCYISRIPNEKHLNIELYNFDVKDYQFITLMSMSLAEFMNTYNQTGHFLRCHNSYIVNIKMVESFSLMNNQLTMLIPRRGGNKIIIDVSKKYRNEVKDKLRGLY